MPDPAIRSRRLGAIPAALLVAVAIWEIGATRCRATNVPGDADWVAAAQHVRMGYQPGDLIVFAPTWADPIGRLHLGDLIPLETAGRMDTARFGRIWELSIRGAHAPEVAGLSPADHVAGPVEMRRYDKPAATVLFDLASAPPPGMRADLVEVAFEPHRCVLVATPPVRPYLHRLLEALDGVPTSQQRVVRTFDALLPELAQARAVPRSDRHGKRITIKSVPLGKALAIGFGIADVFTRRDERRPVELRIETTGEPPSPPLTAPIDRWVVHTLQLGPDARPAVDITFILRWEANPGEPTGNKAVCLAMESRS